MYGSYQTKKGFTLVEMIVALGVFTVVVLVAIGALTAMSAASTRAQSMSIVMDNLNFAVENIARNVRVGSDYHCGAAGDLTTPRSCPTDGDTLLAFRNSAGQTIVFRLSGNQVERSVDGGATFLGVTAPEINISELRFYVSGALPGDGLQPKVLIVVQGTAGIKDIEQADFDIQTTASQRLLDS